MNIYCFSTLSFAKLQFKSVINKAFHKHGVASFTDAWIETYDKGIEDYYHASHLLQMRGLKLRQLGLQACQDEVASFTDAWIETICNWRLFPNRHRSHLLQMRGLKLGQIHFDCTAQLSHLLQMRGLKLRMWWLWWKHFDVASFTDAWIETEAEVSANLGSPSHLLQMRGLKPIRNAWY